MMRPRHVACRIIPKTVSYGFTLIEVAIVLLIIGLILGMVLQSGVTFISTEKRKGTNARLSAIDIALTNYVAQNRRLPCPADGTIASAAANAGVEARTPATGVCTAMNTGVVPWVTLGLAEADAQDGWSNRITYRIPVTTVGAGNIGFTTNQALDMTNCDPAGGAARVDRTLGVPAQSVATCVQNAAGTCDLANTAGCTSPQRYLQGRGIQIRDAAGVNIFMNPGPLPPAAPVDCNGAAYVLISHGDNGFGAYTSNGVLQATANGPTESAMEIWNANNTALQPYYIEAPFNDGAVAAHFDDMLSHPSLMSLIAKAQLGPRAHLQ